MAFPEAPLDGPTLSDVTSRWAARAAVVSGAIASVGLVAYYSSTWRWFSMGRGNVPMAPLTAVLLLALSTALWRRVRERTARALPASTNYLTIAVIAIATVALSVAIRGERFVLNEWLAGQSALVGGYPLGRISPWSAGFIILGALGVRGPRMPFGATAGWERACGLTLLFSSMAFVQGYLLGAPPSYGTTLIPVSALTALALMFLSVGLLLSAGVDRWPMQLLVWQSSDVEHHRPVRGYVALAMIPIALFVSAGIFMYRGARLALEEQALERLSTYADITAEELSAWYQEHASFAAVLHHLPLLESQTNDDLRAADLGARPLGAWLTELGRQRELTRVMIFTPRGRTLFATPGTLRLDAGATDSLLRAANVTDGVVVEDLRVAADRTTPVITYWIPIGSRRADESTAILMLAIEADSSVYPLLSGNPLRFRTAEVEMLRRDGAGVQFLSGLRYENGTAFRKVMPADGRHGIAQRVVLNGVHSGTGEDSRGVTTLFSGRQVAGTPWWIVVKVERAEIVSGLAPLGIRSAAVVLLGVVLVIGVVVGVWYRRDLAGASRELTLLREVDANTDALRNSEARFNRAIAASSDGIWEWTTSTADFYISPKLRRDYGVAPDQTVRLADVYARIPDDDMLRLTAGVRQCIRERLPFAVEHRARTANGAVRWLLTRGSAECNESGKLVRVTGGVTDITERRLADDALQRTDRVLRVSSECNLAVVGATTEAQLLQSVCEIAVRVGGYQLAWVGIAEPDENKTVHAVASAGNDVGYVGGARITWDDAPTGRGPVGRCIRSGEPVAVQRLADDPTFVPWKDAALARGFAAVCSIPLRDDRGVIGALSLYSAAPDAFDFQELSMLARLGRDVHLGVTALRARVERAAGEEQLRLFRQVVERSNDAFLITDVGSGKFIDVSQRACTLLGYSQNELLKLGPMEINTYFNSREEFDRLVDRVRVGDDTMISTTWKRHDGSELPVEISIALAVVQDRELLIGVARDVTERRRAEAERARLEMQLMQAQKMEVVGRLAGGVAHDFNNMLAVILGYSQLALSMVDPTTAIAPQLQEIMKAAERSAALTRQLLAFARLENVKPSIVDVNEVVGGLMKMLQRVIGEDLQLVWELRPSPWRTRIDPRQLESLLANLAVNARDAIGGSGTLSISTADELVTLPPASFPNVAPGEFVCLRVQDDGCGMSEHTLEHLFEPFFTTKEPGKGTGLGLSIVYGIVSQSGGFITVDSAVGKGTTFAVFLPRCPDAPSIEAEVIEEPPRGSERILVVEDEGAVLTLASRMLEHLGYAVISANDPREALRIVASGAEQIDLVLSDLVMPYLNGRELAAEIHRNCPGLPVLFMSGHARDILAADGRHEMVGYLEKPFTVLSLATKVREALAAPATAG